MGIKAAGFVRNLLAVSGRRVKAKRGQQSHVVLTPRTVSGGGLSSVAGAGVGPRSDGRQVLPEPVPQAACESVWATGERPELNCPAGKKWGYSPWKVLVFCPWIFTNSLNLLL